MTTSAWGEFSVLGQLSCRGTKINRHLQGPFQPPQKNFKPMIYLIFTRRSQARILSRLVLSPWRSALRKARECLSLLRKARSQIDHHLHHVTSDGMKHHRQMTEAGWNHQPSGETGRCRFVAQSDRAHAFGAPAQPAPRSPRASQGSSVGSACSHWCTRCEHAPQFGRRPALAYLPGSSQYPV